jgi:hypothetical protein
MRSKARPILAGALAALCAATVSIVIVGQRRGDWLKESGETRRSVVESATRLLPASARAANEPALRAAAEQLARERYVARLWLVDPAGRIVLQYRGPGREGERVDLLAPSDFTETLRGLPDTGLASSQRMQLLAMAAQRRDGDHNDVFKPLVRVVRTPEGADAAFVVLSYDVNPNMGGPSGLLLVAIVGLAVYWAGLVAWVFVDARSRRENSILWALLVLFTNLVGVLAYLLATRRPKKDVPVEARPLEP